MHDPWATCVAWLEQPKVADLCVSWGSERCRRFLLSDAPLSETDQGSTGLIATPIDSEQSILIALAEAGGSATIPQLAKTLALSQRTVRKGLSLLRRAGQIRNRQGVWRIVHGVRPD